MILIQYYSLGLIDVWFIGNTYTGYTEYTGYKYTNIPSPSSTVGFKRLQGDMRIV